MRRFTSVAGAFGAAIAAATLFTGTASAATADHHWHLDQSPVFVQTDNLSGNTVVAYDSSPDGTLTQAGVYQTGGIGGMLAGSVADHLASEGSLTYDPQHHLLYAVNAGSNTITVFSVQGDRLQRRQVISSGGAFPVSITVSHDLVYVLNATGAGSIQGYLRVGDHLILVPSWNRALGLDPTATPQFTHTPGQVAFTPDGRQLLVTTKANTNSIDVFSVGSTGRPSARPVVNALAAAVPFGVTFGGHGQVAVAEAGPSAVATFTLRGDGTLKAGDLGTTGETATCWIVDTGKFLYASNAGSGTLTGYQVGRHGSLTNLGNTATDAGSVDATVSADGPYLYEQTGVGGIVDEFRIGRNGSLTPIGSVVVPGAIGGEGIVAL